MKNPAFLSLFALLMAAPVFAQQSVTITFPSSLSCVLNGTTTSTFAVTSAAFSVTQAVNTGSGSSGAGAGKPVFSTYKVKKIPDACSVPLFAQLLAGTEINGSVVIVYSDTIAGKVTPILTVTLTKVFISELDLKSADSETYYFTFGQISLSNGTTIATGN